ncbi:helix-turn-helix domain-containing protein [Sphingobium sp. Sx8-8]|uniref:IclR family transcriptional regulator domain-containing protein n=1 Tax=Sphingobium sp. Sx8-8 TaxID=2933617 RepID=UPI001F56E82B|nr:helix-turn-helix domain-containing protein [Sphingobium sp. Sx8-8]
MPSYEPVEALVRGLRVLEAVNRLGPCRLADLQAEQLCNRATLVRMLETLMFAGYVHRSAKGNLYAVTPKSRELSSGLSLPSEIARRAEPVLARLQQRCGWPCDVAICDGTDMVTIANSPKEGRLAFNRPAGWTAPVLASSLGLAYAAYCLDAERVSILSRLVDAPGEWNAVARDLAAADKLFEDIRARGYAVMDPRWRAASAQPDLRTIGVPVLVGGRAVAAMNFIFMRQVMELEQAVEKLAGPLREAAAELGAALEILY